jgi:hypothetical protein
VLSFTTAIFMSPQEDPPTLEATMTERLYRNNRQHATPGGR